MTAAQFTDKVVEAIVDAFGSLEAFAEAYNRQLENEEDGEE
jgi:hypothetical protein